MKAKTILLTAAISAAFLMCSCGKQGIKINEDNFRDENFRKYIIGSFDLNGDGYLDSDEIKKVNEIDISSRDVYYLDGIEHFTELTRLNCSGNNLKSLDVGQCKQLTHLDCSNNKLENLDLSHCEHMESLSCDYNDLEDLDLVGCEKLTILSCDDNRLSDLDISHCTKLKTLSCANNSLSCLDVSHCKELETNRCHGNNFENQNSDRSVDTGLCDPHEQHHEQTHHEQHHGH